MLRTMIGLALVMAVVRAAPVAKTEVSKALLSQLSAPEAMPKCTWGNLTGSSAAYMEPPVNAVPNSPLSQQDLKTFVSFVKANNFGNLAASENCMDVAQNCKDLWGFSPFTVDASELPTCKWGELSGSSAAYLKPPVNAVPHTELTTKDLRTFIAFVKTANFGNFEMTDNCADAVTTAKELWGFSPFTVTTLAKSE